MNAAEHIKIASERASTNPEVSQAHSLAAIAILLHEYVSRKN